MRYLIPSCVIALVGLFSVHGQDPYATPKVAEGFVDLHIDAQEVSPLLAVMSVGSADDEDRAAATVAYLQELQLYGEAQAAGMSAEELLAARGFLRVRRQLTKVENELVDLETCLSLLSEYGFEENTNFDEEVQELENTLKQIRSRIPEDVDALRTLEAARATKKAVREGKASH